MHPLKFICKACHRLSCTLFNQFFFFAYFIQSISTRFIPLKFNLAFKAAPYLYYSYKKKKKKYLFFYTSQSLEKIHIVMNLTSMDKFITILQNLHKNILDFKIKFQKSIYTTIVNKQQYTLETSLSMQCWNIDDKQVLKRYPQH